jgi:5-methylcytosine-specific restriction endonuclease McrA
MQRVFVLGMDRKPLMPCRPSRAKELLGSGQVAVFRRYPFTIIMKRPSGKEAQPTSFKIDPGSKTTGIALVADFKRGKTVLWAGEIEHRGQAVRDGLLARRALRRGRRNRKCRHRAPRFLNRTRKAGWLPPSLESRVANVETWLCRTRRFAPVSSISLELVKFDMQKMENPEISGVEYQQGELAGYEVREYLLEKWGRRCAYCGIGGVPLQVEHIVPKSRGGSNRVSNLALSCDPCNKAKDTRTAAEFGHPEIQSKAEEPLKDAAAVNATRWVLYVALRATGLPVECGTGGRTKLNRMRLGHAKAHWTDAACVGVSGEDVHIPALVPLRIRATGRGRRRRCLVDAFGFPRAHAKRTKTFLGWRTGDIARAVIPEGKHKGTAVGKVAIRHRPSFRIGKIDVHPKHLTRLHRSDGYEYNAGTRLLPGLKSGVPAA